MIKHRLFFILLFCLFASSGLKSQDELLLMNGKLLKVHITDDSGANVFFEAEKKSGKLKTFDIYKADIFSITKEGQVESVLYAKDEMVGNEYTIDQMRFYIYGQNDARNGFKTWPTAAGGALFGVGGVFLMEGGFFPFAIFPVVYSLGMQIPYVKIRKETISDISYTQQVTYKEGYNKTSRSKKFIHSFLATFGGVAIGSAIYEISN